jgi:hypothetical protein
LIPSIKISLQILFHSLLNSKLTKIYLLIQLFSSLFKLPLFLANIQKSLLLSLISIAPILNHALFHIILFNLPTHLHIHKKSVFYVHPFVNNVLILHTVFNALAIEKQKIFVSVYLASTQTLQTMIVKVKPIIYIFI